MLLGVDVGGTFTDAVLFDGRALHTAKAPTTPDDQSRGVLAAVEAALERAGASSGQVEAFAHGMTVGTNALLEERGARTALVATEGFSDLLDIARQNRPHLYRLCAPKPRGAGARRASLRRPGAHRSRGRRRPARGHRAGPGGAASCAPASVESVAICLLFSYLDPAHERAIAERLRAELPDLHVSASHEVLPQFREYERCSTTVIDAYLSPLLGRYLGRLASAGSRARAAGAAGDEVLRRRRAGLRGRSGGSMERALGPRGRRGRRGPAGDPLGGRERGRARHGGNVLRRLRGRGRPGAAHRLAPRSAAG